ncbi:NACHT domain-containing protein [Pseudoalteromonas sp. B137]|jgi:hypothetical protein
MSMLGVIAVKAATSKVVGKSVEKVFSSIKKSLNTAKLKSATQKYIQRLNNDVRLQTFLDKRSIELDKLYVPAKIRSSIGSSTYELDDLSPFMYEGLQLLVGEAGLGKTTALKRLLSILSNTHDKVPFFIPLKEMRAGELFSDFLLRQLEQWGIPLSSLELKNFLNFKNVTLLLDGFDEINTSNIDSVAQDIYSISCNNKCNLVVTTRPDTLITKMEYSYEFSILRIDNSQRKLLIEKYKLATNIDFNINRKLEKISYLDELIVNPLLIALLFVIFKSKKSFPENEIDFYGGIFLALYRNHDDRKGGVKRAFKANLSYSDAETIFRKCSFLSFSNKDIEFNRFELVNYISKSVGKGHTVDPELFLEDLVNVTNIIMETEYDTYSYVHRSIQEFYAYRYILDYGLLSHFLKENLKYGFKNSIWNKQIITFALKDFRSSNIVEDYLRPLYQILFLNFLASDGKDNFGMELAVDKYLKNCYLVLQYGHIRQKTKLSDLQIDLQRKVINYKDADDYVIFRDSVFNYDKSKFENDNPAICFWNFQQDIQKAIIQIRIEMSEVELLTFTELKYSEEGKYRISLSQLAEIYSGSLATKSFIKELPDIERLCSNFLNDTETKIARLIKKLT